MPSIDGIFLTMNIQYPDKVSSIFSELSSLIKEELFLVGGSTRDLILGKSVDDLDFATRADPLSIHALFPDKLYFEKYGTTTFKVDGYHITLASYRKESDYTDYRHPSKVEFLKDYKEDSKRRDFTINALYGDISGEIFDPTGLGLKDIEEKRIRIIGDPTTRLIEDPLRILRALRFSEELSFSIDNELEKAIKKEEGLLNMLNPNKIMEEIRKFPKDRQDYYLSLYYHKDDSI